jgi:hypothetical protein
MALCKLLGIIIVASLKRIPSEADKILQKADIGPRFLYIEIFWLKMLFVLFFITLGTRRIHLTRPSVNPDST